MRIGGSAYWAAVAGYVVVLFAVQPFLGFGVDLFKERWGTLLLDRLAYGVVGIGALAVLAAAARLWVRTTVGDRLGVAAALGIYGLGTAAAGSPQERLHYLEYGLLAGLLYFGWAWPAPAAADRDAHPAAPAARHPTPSTVLEPEARRRLTAAFSDDRRLAAAAALVVGCALGALDEVLQIWWPRRYFDWRDVGINVTAVAFGLLVGVPLLRALRAPPPPR